MKKLFLYLFLGLIFCNVSFAIDSRCTSTMDNVIANKDNLVFDELDYYDYYQPQIKFAKKWDNEKEDWVFYRDKNNNLEITKIFDYEIIDEKKLKIGDKLIKINGKNVSKINNEELDKLLNKYNHGDYEENISEDDKKKLSFSFLNAEKVGIKKYENDTIDYDLGLILMEDGQADAAVTVKIRNISNINVKENHFEADLDIATTWQHHKLYQLVKDDLTVKDNDGKVTGYWYCIFSPEEFEKMQVGEVFSKPFNAIRKDKTLIENKYQFYIGDMYYSKEALEKGDYDKYIEVTRKEEGNFTLSNKYNLKAFPFDRQILSIKILDPTRGIHSLNLRMDSWTQLDLDEFKKNGEIVEWNIIGTSAKYFNYFNPTEMDVYSGVQLLIEIQRDFEYYIYKVICPIVLILLVCWSVFWINPKEIESRLTITIVCLLSLIAYNFVIDEDLPKLSYLTIIDYIILLAYVFATIPNFLSIASFELHRQRNNKWKKIDRASKRYGLPVFICLVFIIISINASGNPYTAAFLSFLR